ncbi:MAG: hypothetical protein ABI680_15440 [Chthoniobacteraceae bacterium]
MKTTEASEFDAPRPLVSKPETRFTTRREMEGEDYVPRYVDVPRRRRSIRAGRRNLFWGIALFFAGLFVLTLGVLMSGPRAVLWPGVAAVTFAVLWVLARLKIFHERNGVFFSLALVLLVGAVMAVCERGFEVLVASSAGRSLMVPPARANSEKAESASTASAPLLLSRVFKLSPVDSAMARIRVLSDTNVIIGDNTYRVMSGETFPFAAAKEGIVIFSAGEFQAQIPQNAVEILAPERGGAAGGASADDPSLADLPEAPPDPAALEITKRAQDEAARRFPALADSKSPENQEFVRTYKELKDRNSALLQDPQWPVLLAEILAKRMNWQEVAPAAADGDVVGRGGPPMATPGAVGPEPAGLNPDEPEPGLPEPVEESLPPPPPPTPSGVR